MLNFLRGQKESIRKLCGCLEIDLEICHQAPLEIDVSCFGLDAAGKLSNERYFVFYNQTETPDGAVSLRSGTTAGSVRFHLRLEQLPPHIARLAFTASIDGSHTMQEMEKGYVRLLRDRQETGRFSYDRAQFQSERAIVICEVYRKGSGWRFSAVGRGFNGGLKALVESFGGIVASSAPSQIHPVPCSMNNDITATLPAYLRPRMDSLLRQCRGDTEYLASIYKNMFTALANFPQTAEKPVQVIMCADASGSMYDIYRNGKVQRITDLFFVFTSALSGCCNMDFWAFGAKSRQFGAVTIDNIRDYTYTESGGFERWMGILNYQINNEPEAMRDITMIYGNMQKPVMVLFLTDGRLNSDWEIEELLIKTSRFPLYWQFIGLHGNEYGILEWLRDIDGRRTNNAGFLKLDDINDQNSSTLFHGILSNLDVWLRELDHLSQL